ncbi:MAG: response regulator transcription factor [Clostridiales bacterium]|jgi:two-component system LytT family response regulator|nr:response regulator transcription factor [Clostridiales bacterium]
MKLKVFIADDDAGMRLVLKRIMESMDGIEFIGEAADGEEAVRRCIDLRPDVVFIDVEMPVLSGVEAARQLVEHLPELALIFVTAHSEYMPDAFEVYAYDYLLKPFKTDRVRQTLRRLQRNKMIRKTTPLKTLMLKNRERMSFIPVEEIILLYRENKLTYIVTAEETHSTSESLNNLQQKLATPYFFRSHRAFIINMNFISKIYPYGRWTYLIKMKGTEKDALITHEKLEQLQDFLASR